MQGPPICGPQFSRERPTVLHERAYKTTEEIHYAFDH